MGKSLTSFFMAMVLLVPGVCNAQELPTEGTMPAGNPHVLYMKTVRDHVNSHWAYKKTFDNQFYLVQVELMLDKKGYVLEMKMLTLSSDDDFNDSALKALVEMQPYPPIPDYLDGDMMGFRCHLMPNS